METPTTGSFCNDGGITMPGQNNTLPYPSVINVTGISNAVATVSLTLNGFSWSPVADAVHLLLVSPNNQALEFFSASDGATTGTYTFIDSGAQAPEETGITPNSYQPTVYTTGDVFTPQPPLPAPQVPSSFNVAAPAGGSSAGTFESSFNGATSTGAWSLFVYDDDGTNASGSITGGWCLDITQATGAPTTTTVTATPNPALTGAPVTVTATVKSGGTPVNAVGVVTFTENGQNVAGGPTSPVAVNSSGQASFTTSSLAEGDHDITGTYSDTTGTYALSFGSRYVRVDNPTTVTSSNGVTSYCNPGTITIPGPLNPIDDGPASPNPSNIFVASAPGTINHVTVTLNGVELSTPYFLTSLLVGPLDTTANSLDFFSDVGGSSPMGSPVNITLDDSASSGLPEGNAGSPLVSGTFKPTSAKGNDTFSPSASGFYTPPSGPYQYAAPIGSDTFGLLYDNENPNGTWSLYLYQNNQSTDSRMTSWCVNLTENPPVLAIAKSHNGDFTQGQTGAQYTVAVTNNGPGSTGGTVTVTENPPTGLTVTGMTGNNWSCSGTSCTRSDALAQGGTYDEITVTVNVAGNAPASVTNQVTVSGGGAAAAATANDPTTVNPAPVLSVSKTHVGTGFTGGLTGEWDIAVSNTASGSTTSGTLTVTDSLPSGFTLSPYLGSGWNCTGSTSITCTSSQAVSGGSSFPTIALTVNVPSVNSPTMFTNTAFASGGGSLASANGSDTVQVNPGTYQLTTSASPLAGGTVSPASGPQTAGSVVNLVATPNSGYAFQNWTSSPDTVANPTSASTTITMNSAETVTANFVVNTVNVTVGTSPTGLAFSVDGTNYTSTQNFTWTIGTPHTIATTTPQTPVAGTQYNFTSWSDGGSLSHSVTASANTTSYTASFSTSYQLITAANPSNGGTVTPASGSYYPTGTVVSLTATPNSNYAFVNWTGNVANQSSASTTVTMNAPQSVTANFSLSTINVTVGTNPVGLAFSVDGMNYTSTQTLTWTIGSPHTIATTTPQTTTGTQYNFTSWSDGGALSHSVTASAGTTSYTASFSTLYLLKTAANPSNGGTVSPASGSYYPANTVVNLTATPTLDFVFSNWTGNVANPNSASTTVTMTAPESVTANFVSAAIIVSPTAINFGNVILGRGAKVIVTVQNNTSNTVDIGPITLTVTQGDASQFKLDHVCTERLKPGKDCYIGVAFRPDAIGSDTATLNIVTSAPGSPIEIPITAAGVPKN